jgi:GNAT superfamily N-acetyltransferase
MREVIVNGEAYTCVTDYKENDELRKSFNVLTQKTYKFDFEFWYHYGYWGDKYIPYSLLKDNKVVANAFVNIIDFTILGEDKRYIQIGTVMTGQEYRGKGLSRFLMERILKDWESRCDLIYLFANESVLDFYPKFGFIPMGEYQCSKSVVFKETKTAV